MSAKLTRDELRVLVLLLSRERLGEIALAGLTGLERTRVKAALATLVEARAVRADGRSWCVVREAAEGRLLASLTVMPLVDHDGWPLALATCRQEEVLRLVPHVGAGEVAAVLGCSAAEARSAVKWARLRLAAPATRD